jgi:NAD(P)-dependent dehydrogenase (short-subunit alcohol dehydrogenase family)
VRSIILLAAPTSTWRADVVASKSMDTACFRSRQVFDDRTVWSRIQIADLSRAQPALGVGDDNARIDCEGLASHDPLLNAARHHGMPTLRSDLAADATSQDSCVRGVFLAIQAAAAHLSEGGRVITIGSNTAVRSSYPGSSVYAMTKAAVAVMVKGIAVDLAPRGIIVNNIQPGPTRTDMTAGHVDSITPTIPLKRAGDPDEIAGLVAYLASEESGYITGSSLTIDGGMAL